MRGRAGTAGVFMALGAATGCSSLESGADTYCTFHCGTDPPDSGTPDVAPGGGADAAMTGDAMANPWWCESNGMAVTYVPPPPPPSPRPTVVHYYLPVIDFASVINNTPMPVPVPTPGAAPLPPPVIVACDASDYQCSNPITPKVVAPTASSPSPFTYQIELPYGFNGSIRLTATGYVPTQYFFGGPLVGTPTATMDAENVLAIYGLFITPLAAVNAPFLGGETPDPTKGIFGPRLLDCNGARADKVTLVVEKPTGTGFTLVNNTPIFGNPPEPTDPRGVSGYGNMVPGTYVASALTPDMTPYGRTGVFIIAGTLTIIEIRTDNQGILGR